MARIRSVKPELCESETMAAVSAEVERTFVRLWTHCDDEGRCKDNPKLIKAALFPLHDDVTPADVDSHLAELAAVGAVVRYEVDGVRYLAVPSWKEHQHPQKPRKSTIPEPPAVAVPDVSRTPPVAVEEQSGPVVEGSGVVEVVGEGAGITTSPTCEELPPDEQIIRRAAVLVGRRIAAVDRPDDDGRYAAGVTKRILTEPSGEDRGRIVALLGDGLSPEQVVEAWAYDPLASLVGATTTTRPEQTRPALSEWTPDPDAPSERLGLAEVRAITRGGAA